MKKKLNIQFLKKSSFFFLAISLVILPVFAQVNNPFLKNNFHGDKYSSDRRTVLIVFDASGSMEEKINNETKIHIAKRVLDDVLLNAPQDINLGLRVYGADVSNESSIFSCGNSKLLIPPGTNNRRSIISEIYKVLPKGVTPITYSLVQAINDLSPYSGEKSIVLISDGLETCGGDPCRFAKSLDDSGIDLKIDVVGFGVADDLEAQTQLMCISTSTMARYFQADNSDDLAKGLKESINKSVTGKIITPLKK